MVKIKDQNQNSSDSYNQQSYWVLTALFSLAIILVPFQNTALQLTPLRYLGASPSFLPIAIFCLFAFIIRISNSNISKKPELLFLLFLIYSIIPTIWGIIVIDSADISLKFLLQKTVTNTILNILLLYPIFIMPKPTKMIQFSIFGALGISVAGYILVDILGIFAFPSFFQASSAVTTPRGFSLEQSAFAASIVTLCLISAAIANKSLFKILLIGVAIIFTVIITSSKGTMICLIMALGMTFIFSNGKNILFKIFVLILIAVLGWFVIGKLSERFRTDIEESTSSSTRSILILSSIPSAIQNPIGVGYSGYIPAIIKYMYPTSEFMKNNILPNTNMSELESYIQREGKQALNIKSQFFEYLMVFGIPSLIVLIIFHLRLYRKIKTLPNNQSTYYLFLFWFTLLSLMTYMPALGLYFYTIAYGIMLHTNKHNASSDTINLISKKQPPDNFIIV